MEKRKASDLNLKEFTNEDFKVNPSEVTYGKELGRGNFSKVYLGKFKGDTVAIKKQVIVDPDLERYLLKELSLLRRLKSPYVIGFYGAYREEANIANIITEYVEGGDLRRLLQETTTLLGWKLRVEIAHGCAEGIRYLHEREVIHRDIKTENVLLDRDCVPKICDFGFARKISRGEPHMTMCGTDEFMAPEIMFGMVYDEKADIYSFGIMLAEIVTRKHPGKVTGFLDRLPKDGFGINVEELDREYEKVQCPTSLHLLTKEMLSNEGESRPSAKDIQDWLSDLKAEMQPDKEPKPVLSGESVIETLDRYIAMSSTEESHFPGDDKYEGSNRPTSVEAQNRVVEALKERDLALNGHQASSAPTSGRGLALSSHGVHAPLPNPLNQSNNNTGKKNAGPQTSGTTTTTTTTTNSSSSTANTSTSQKDSSAKKKEDVISISIPNRPASKSATSNSGESFTDRFFSCFKTAFAKDKVGAAANAAPDWERQVGWVLKRGGRVRTWKRRYMVLTSLGIVYCKGEEVKAEEAQGTIEFSEMTEVAGAVCNAIPTVMTGKPYSFGVHSLKRTYYMAASSEKERDKWIQAICEGYYQFHTKKKKQGKKKA